jgi:hypothetical protein
MGNLLDVPARHRVPAAYVQEGLHALFPIVSDASESMAVLKKKHNFVLRLGDAVRILGEDQRRKELHKGVVKKLPYRNAAGELCVEVYWLYHWEEMDNSLHHLIPTDADGRKALFICVDHPDEVCVEALDDVLLASVPVLRNKHEHDYPIVGVYQSATKKIGTWSDKLPAKLPSRFACYMLQGLTSVQQERRRRRVHTCVSSLIERKLTGKASEGGDLKAMSYAVDVAFEDVVCLGPEFASMFVHEDGKLIAVIEDGAQLELLSGRKFWDFQFK